jgi:lipopolysaccharide transport system ATP-binding protein
MSDEAIISVENLGKRYSLRHLRDQRYIALRDVLVEKATGLFRRRRDHKSAPVQRGNGTTGLQDQSTVVRGQPSSSPLTEDFWALRNINFEVKQGEVVGIIGRNGAGKSTLLKILSRITDPTEGKVTLRGRVASLLEVGTGFHPELTGRENIYLNGAILGMHRAEIKAKFDEIVAFAETEKFLDTPVKRYSSGMYVRLAFAVAAHLEPEILLVDEVLAVGDADFQKKCLGKMREVSRQNKRAVLFVSHNMTAIRSLCDRCLILEAAKKAFDGEVGKGVLKYLGAVNSGGGFDDQRRIYSCSQISVVGGRLLSEAGETSQFVFGESLTVEIALDIRENIKFSIELVLRDQQGMPIAFSPSGLGQGVEYSCRVGRHRIRCHISRLDLAEGNYALDIMLAETRVRFLDYLESALRFTIGPTQIGPRNWNFSQRGGQGCFLLPVSYQLEMTE